MGNVVLEMKPTFGFAMLMVSPVFPVVLFDFHLYQPNDCLNDLWNTE